MNKNIVIFGCDNSGKTTLCYALQDTLSTYYTDDVEVIKSIGANKTIEEYLNFMNENLKKDCVTLFDRFPIIEEEVTGVILRGNSLFGSFSTCELFKYLSKVDLFIYCYPGFQNIKKWEDREQMDGIKENVDVLIPGYLQFALKLQDIGCNVFEYNYNCDAMDSKLLVDNIMEVLNI